jgi:trehalose 6-phosphate synthase
MAGANRSPLVLVSNRGPIEHTRDDDGARVIRRGGGGLVTALDALAGLTGAVWVCNAMTDEDRVVAKECPDGFLSGGEGRQYSLRIVSHDPVTYQRFYSIVANPMLWFVQHYLWDISNAPNITANELEAFDEGYVRINADLAEAAAEEVDAHGGDAIVMVHDYQLYLVPAHLRERCPRAFIHHFIHIPWPQPDAWRILPSRLRDPLLHGLLSADVVAFHTEHSAQNFLFSCQDLLDLPVDFKDYTVRAGGRTVAARWYPISIDASAMEEAAAAPEVTLGHVALENIRREHLILRVDRTDLSKNILRGFQAFEQLLRDHPELTGRVTFLALLQPSRQDVPEYVEYLEKIRRLVADINLEFGHADWQPIDLRIEDAFHQTVAAYKLFDVLVVNPVFDGLNLVAKEGMLLNERDGVLILSEHAGVHAELGAFALSVHPFDIDAQAEALWRALVMDRSERRARHQACVEIIRSNDVSKWLQVQLADIDRIRSGRLARS